MPCFTFSNVKISGISSVIPSKEFSLLDDKDLYNGDQKRITRVIKSSGFLKRRISDPEVMTSDLCLQAAQDLLENLQVKKEEIDALLFLSYTPDYLMPATSYVLHGKLELSQNCVCMDIPQACSGYEIGLYQASMLINSGCKKVLMLVGDSFSKFTDMFIDHTAPVFGDAGTATLVEYDENSEKSYFILNSDGQNHDALICRNGGFKNPPNREDFYDNGGYMYRSKMDGGRIFDFTMEKIAPSIESLMQYANIGIDKIDHFIFHQANKFILQNIALKLGIPMEKINTDTLTNYGNQCGASIPCTISNVYRQDVAANQRKCLLSGFGVGLSWASAIVDLNNIYCSDLMEYKGM